MDYVPLVLADMDEYVVANLFHTLTRYNEEKTIPDYVYTRPDELNTVFIFQDDKLICQENITAAFLARFMAVFHNENLVDFSGPRYSWYGQPRRDKTFFLPD